MQTIETHPFPAVIVANARVMMTGTLPPRPEKWCMPFHYPNFQNDMWRIYGMVFFRNRDYFQVAGEKRFDPVRIENFLRSRRIALVPSVKRAIRERGNAADAFLHIVEATDLAVALAQMPECRWLMTTGGKATEIVLSLCQSTQPLPKTNQSVPIVIAGRTLTLYRLPSTSRAYPLAFAKKVAAYRAFFRETGLLTGENP